MTGFTKSNRKNEQCLTTSEDNDDGFRSPAKIRDNFKIIFMSTMIFLFSLSIAATVFIFITRGRFCVARVNADIEHTECPPAPKCAEKSIDDVNRREILLEFDGRYGFRVKQGFISEISSHSPAERAGLLVGDMILSVNDENILDKEDHKIYRTHCNKWSPSGIFDRLVRGYSPIECIFDEMEKSKSGNKTVTMVVRNSPDSFKVARKVEGDGFVKGLTIGLCLPVFALAVVYMIKPRRKAIPEGEQEFSCVKISQIDEKMPSLCDETLFDEELSRSRDSAPNFSPAPNYTSTVTAHF